MSTPATNVNCAALVALASLAVMAQASPARAGAFNMAEGEGQIIVASTFSGANQSFDLDGKLRSTNRFSKFETTALLQYGFTDWLTLIAKPSFVATSLGGAPGGSYSGLGPTELGAQARLLQFGSSVVSLQASVRLPGAPNSANIEIGRAHV